MERPTRRQLLAGVAALTAGILLPIGVKGADPSPEELEVQAQALACNAERIGQAVAFGTARTHLGVINSALTTATRETRRRPLHRAASTTAVICARTARHCGLDGREWLTLAEAEARTAGDGPLLAQAWLERATSEGTVARSAEYPCPTRLTLATAALDRAGIGHEQSGIRAAARWKLAWELAVEGNQHGALLELDAATFEAEKASWAGTAINEMVGGIMRKLGRLEEAELALSRALGTSPVRRVWVLSDLARTYLASGDVDGAAGALEESFLLTRAHGIEGRLIHIVAVRSLLPPGRAARELDEVMRGR